MKECTAGIIRTSVIVMNAENARKLEMNFSRTVCSCLGQSPINSKLKRFNFTAHSKSIYPNKRFKKSCDHFHIISLSHTINPDG